MKSVEQLLTPQRLDRGPEALDHVDRVRAGARLADHALADRLRARAPDVHLDGVLLLEIRREPAHVLFRRGGVEQQRFLTLYCAAEAHEYKKPNQRAGIRAPSPNSPQCMHEPPSTTSVCPVTKSLSEEAKNATAP